MNEHLKDPFFDYGKHLLSLPDHVLRDIARNDCADRGYRRQAVEILVVRKSVMANHPELADLKAELDVELDGLQFEYPAPEEIPTAVGGGDYCFKHKWSVLEKGLCLECNKPSGPLTASVTTKTMFSDGPVPELSTVDLELSTVDLELSTDVQTTDESSVPPQSDTKEPPADAPPAE